MIKVKLIGYECFELYWIGGTKFKTPEKYGGMYCVYDIANNTCEDEDGIRFEWDYKTAVPLLRKWLFERELSLVLAQSEDGDVILAEDDKNAQRGANEA